MFTRELAEGKALLVDIELRVAIDNGVGSDTGRIGLLKVCEGIELEFGILYYRCQ